MGFGGQLRPRHVLQKSRSLRRSSRCPRGTPNTALHWSDLLKTQRLQWMGCGHRLTGLIDFCRIASGIFLCFVCVFLFGGVYLLLQTVGLNSLFCEAWTRLFKCTHDHSHCFYLPCQNVPNLDSVPDSKTRDKNCPGEVPATHQGCGIHPVCNGGTCTPMNRTICCVHVCKVFELICTDMCSSCMWL